MRSLRGGSFTSSSSSWPCGAASPGRAAQGRTWLPHARTLRRTGSWVHGAVQHRPRALITAGLYLRRALCSFLTVSPGSFCSGNECQAEPSNALCKDERSQSRIGKQLLPYYTWPCTRRVHHHAVVPLTRRGAQQSCRVQSVLDKQRDAALLCLRDTISGDQDTIAG